MASITELVDSSPTDTHSVYPLARSLGSAHEKKEGYLSDAELARIAYSTFLQLRPDDREGIKTATKGGFFDECGHGRDTALMTYDAISTYAITRDPILKDMARSGLSWLFETQATNDNPENGAQKGKTIHEVRYKGFEFLINSDNHKPWYHNKEKNVVESYDSVDSTALTLIAADTFLQTAIETSDTESINFIKRNIGHISSAIYWSIRNLQEGEPHLGYLTKFFYPRRERHGGLDVQNWTDSQESLLQPNGEMPKDPISPIEAQAFTWKALMAWGFTLQKPELIQIANEMKRVFNQKFIITDNSLSFGAQALDGNGNPIRTITGNPLFCSWASYVNPETGQTESIVDRQYWRDFAKRGQMADMMSKRMGLRTMSTQSPTFIGGSRSYHNGASWGVLNSKVYEGFLEWGELVAAENIYNAWLDPFRLGEVSPTTELTNEDHGRIVGFENPGFNSQKQCDGQGWSASGLLHAYTLKEAFDSIIRPIYHTSEFVAD